MDRQPRLVNSFRIPSAPVSLNARAAAANHAATEAGSPLTTDEGSCNTPWTAGYQAREQHQHDRSQHAYSRQETGI